MRCWAATVAVLLAAALPVGAQLAWEPSDLVLVLGAPGEAEYGKDHHWQAEQWTALAEAGGHRLSRIGSEPDSETSDRERLQETLAAVPRAAGTPLWLILIGHGTFDGKEARFNLRGPDLTPSDFAEWLEPFQRPVVVVLCASASSPFLPVLAGPGRVILTATRSGFEQNATHLGRMLAAAWVDPEADLDHDGQVSLLEAAVVAGRRVAEFYEGAGRLLTEHALLEDNGDGLGTPLDWFRGVRAVKQPREGAEADGLRAHQIVLVPSPSERALPAAVRARRDGLERSIEALRQRKSSLTEEDYYRELEGLLLELARLLAGAEPPAPGDSAGAARSGP